MSGNPRHLSSYYFDASVYLAYLRNEEADYGKDRIRAIDSVWQQSERGGVAVVTSALSLTEVLAQKISQSAEKKFLQAFQSGIHQFDDVTPPIALRARHYRDFYKLHPIKCPGGDAMRSDLSTPDAIHLATAVIIGCDQFWTFDGVSLTGKKKTIGMLWLGNRVGADSLVITQPELLQGELPI